MMKSEISVKMFSDWQELVTLSYSSPGPCGGVPFILGHPYRISARLVARLVTRDIPAQGSYLLRQEIQFRKSKRPFKKLKKFQDKNSFESNDLLWVMGQGV